MTNKCILITEAGGFVGHHLASYLVSRGYRVRGAGEKRSEYGAMHAREFFMMDLGDTENWISAAEGFTETYRLAANARSKTQMNTAMIEAPPVACAKRFLCGGNLDDSRRRRGRRCTTPRCASSRSWGRISHRS